MVAFLNFRERVVVDVNRLSELQARLGLAGTDDAVSTALEDVAVAIPKMQQSIEIFDGMRLVELASDVEILSAHVGMETLAIVARQIAEAAMAADDVALPAIMARLSRVWEVSVVHMSENAGLCV